MAISLEGRRLILTVAILVTLTIAIAAWRLAPLAAGERIVYDTVPDRPLSFGYKMAWIAVRADSTEAVAAVLGLGEPREANWSSGLGTVYDDDLGQSRVFLSPPVGGTVFLVGLALPPPVGPAFVDKCTPLLGALAARFGDVQFYFSYPLIDFFAWARFTGGREVRAFAIGDEGVIWNRGRMTREERALGLRLFDLRGIRGRRGDAGGEILLHPTEEHVLRLAGAWGIDPTRLASATAVPATGRIYRVPAAWRAELARKAA